jgi:microsomal epoxide hydrolase
VLPLLTSATGDDVVFDVVAPSLAGYAWSEAPRTKGFGLKQHAEQIHKLMLKLGYSEYGM